MKVGFLLSANYALGNPGNGVLAQAKHQAAALESLGCEVTQLNPWDVSDASSYDVIQFYQGGFNFFGIESIQNVLVNGILVFAPIIDSNQSNIAYRIAAELGNLSNKFHSIPGMLQRQAKCSDLVICRSEHESKRLRHGLNISQNKVEIVLNGTHLPPPKSVDITSIRQKYNLPPEYILHVSAYTQERKNVLRLAKAATELDLPLIIAGNGQSGYMMDKLQSISKINPKIQLMGFVDRELLNALYACCKIFCLPSIHEGTGLVALEAGVYGAEVVITNKGGTLDYFNDYATFVDPFSVSNIKQGILNAWHKPKSDDLKHHIYNNLSWDNSAKKLLETYQKHIETKLQKIHR